MPTPVGIIILTKFNKMNIIKYHEKIAKKNHQKYSESSGRPLRAYFIMISFFREDRLYQTWYPKRIEW